jgi:hypothetical protein
MKGSHNSNIDLTFYNDKVKDVMDAATMAEPFTYVPIKAGHMELIGGNAIVFGKITEGEDIINPEISTELSYETVSAVTSRIDLTFGYQQTEIEISYPYASQYNINIPYYAGDIVYVGNYALFYQSLVNNNLQPLDNIAYWLPRDPSQLVSYRTIKGIILIVIPMNIYVDGYYYISLANSADHISYRLAQYQAQPGDTIADVKTGLNASLIANGFDVEVVPYPDTLAIYPWQKSFQSTPVYQHGNINDVYSNFTVSAYILFLGNTIKYPILKCGASHGFGIVYKDRAGRQCSVMKTDLMNVYIPFYTELNGVDNLLESIAKLKFKVYHKPPEWAETYEIVYFGNNTMDYEIQIRESDVAKIPFGTHRYSLNINQTLAWLWQQNNRWKMAPYEWTQGDRMRLVGTIDPNNGIVTKYTDLYDYEIEETGTRYGDVIGGDWLIFQAINHPNDLDLGETSITNLTIDLSGTVFHTVPNGDAVKRVDTITLTGNDGTATICCGTLERTATYNTSLDLTAGGFAASYVADYLAIGIDLTSNNADIIFTAHVEGVDFPSPTNILLEIYRPKKGLTQKVAYGTGMVFDIGVDNYGNRYHKGDVDQVFDAAGICTGQAEVNNTANDCWKFIRLNYKFNTSDIQPFWAESIFPSDWWGGLDINLKLTSCGFPFLDDLSLRQSVLDERIRHGGFILTGTRTNNIAHFVYDDFRDLPEKDGMITGLREIGFTLKVIQEHKETSIYINRIQTFNPDGTEQFTLTDSFLGTVRPMEDNYGCQHPGSIMLNGRNLYYWDNNEGAFICSAPNGQQVISGPELKMSRWFKDTLRWIRLSGGGSILQTRTGWNEEHKEVWLNFRMGNEVRGIIFSEKKGRYITRYDQITEEYVHLGNFFAHLYHQRLWIINIDEGQKWLYWSGIPTYAEIETVSNIESLKNKVFKAVALFADHLLQSLSKYVYIPKEASGSDELMETNIPIFDRREGVYFGEIMKDENSKGNFANIFDAKLNGRAMRGRYAFVRFRTEEHTEKVRIFSIAILSTPSERNI